MRGAASGSSELFRYVRLEERVPQDHPLRAARALADVALARLDAKFSTLYSRIGRPSIPPEMLLRAKLLTAFYSAPSEQLDSNRNKRAPGALNRSAGAPDGEAGASAGVTRFGFRRATAARGLK